jgi:hypothetical protein
LSTVNVKSKAHRARKNFTVFFSPVITSYEKSENDLLGGIFFSTQPLSPATDFTELLMEQLDPAFSLEQDELNFITRRGKNCN